MAAELRLGVSFDLVYFRQQLGKLSQIAASEFTGKVKLNIDKRDFQRQFSSLTKELRINVNDSQIVGARENLGQLNRSLATLRRAVAAPIEIKVKYTEQGKPPAGFGGTAARAVTGRIGGTQAIEGASRAELQKIYGLFREANLRVGQLSNGLGKATAGELRAAIVPAFSDSGEEAVNGLANGLKDGSSKVGKAAARLGQDTLRSIKDVLGIASPSREFKKIGEDSGEGFEQGLKSGLGEAARMGVQEMRSLFRALQGEAQSGAARLQATMLAAMAGIVQLPGGRQQRGRLMQTGAGINAAMTGSALGNIQARQGAVRGAAQGAAASTPTFAAALPLMFGMNPRELTARLQGLHGQRYRAPAMGGHQAARPGVVASLIAALASARGGLSAGGAVNQRSSSGGAVNPGVLSSGYIGRSALSAGFVNYPPGMPAAYGSNFVGGGAGSYGMAPGRMQGPMMPVRGVFSTASSPFGQFPSAGMMGPSSPLGSMGRFPSAGMMYPSSSLGVINAQSSMFGGGGGPSGPGGSGGGGGGGGGFGGFPRVNFGGPLPNLPGQGLVREMGSEFGFAAKQVLLFGAAYKGLALLTGLPGQVTEAVSALQNFRNTLTAITPSSEEFRDSNQLILDLVEKYNVPLQSARDGFTKLYASMHPAGFSGDEVRTLFTGISKAAATFGMSADKVDRVNYAFAQMASKGQVMSEELKGQLGDVLPGAMAIFTEAAGYKGPNAISEFSKALEDGAYKGDAMRVLLTNVGAIMNKEFGPGAEGAARTFQGAMNRMQNSMKLLYETFEPVAIGFLNAVVTPVSNGIKTLTDGLNAFFTGATAKTSGGFGIAQELEKLRPAFEGLSKNVGDLAKQFLQMAGIGLEVAKVLLQIAGNPFVGYIAKVYAVIVPLNLALSVFRGVLASTALQFLVFNARLLTGTSTLGAFRGMMAATGQTAAATSAIIRGAFATTGIGLVLVGLGLLIERFSSLSQRMQDVRDKAAGAAQAIRAMSQTEARTEEYRIQRSIKDIQTLQQSKNRSQLGGQEAVGLSGDMARRLEESGVPVRTDLTGRKFLETSQLEAQRLRLQGLASEAGYRQRQLKFQEAEAQRPVQLAPIPPGEGDKEKGEKLKQYISDASKLYDKEKDRELLAVEDRLLRKEIGETEAKNLEALINKTYEILAVTEALRVAEIEINNEKLSAADKNLKLLDLQKESRIELDNINKRYGIETMKAQLALQKPLEDAIKGTNEEITKQSMLNENLKNGVNDLTYDQKAQLDIHELTKDLVEAERKAVEKLIETLRKRREEYYKNEEVLKRQKLLSDLQNRIGVAQSPFGRERITELEQEGYDSAFATGIDALEKYAEKAERIKQSFKDLEGTIRSSLGTAITDVLTDFNSMNDAVMRLRQSVADAFKQMANMIIQEMLRAAVHWAVKQLFSFMSPNLQGPAPTAPSPGVIMAANGGVLTGGFQAFAAGGVVTGPTLGLVGEGRFNEAVVPLPNGRSIPVDLGGGTGSNISTNIVVNMNNGQASSQSSGRGGQALGRELEGAVRSVILKETRPGGLIYSGR